MITLENLCGKQVTLAVYDRLNKAIERAYLNLMDEDTDQEEKRVVTLKITMKADKDSNVISVTADVQTKVAREKSIGTFFPKERGQAYIDPYGEYHTADPETGEIMEAEDE